MEHMICPRKRRMHDNNSRCILLSQMGKKKKKTEEESFDEFITDFRATNPPATNGSSSSGSSSTSTSSSSNGPPNIAEKTIIQACRDRNITKLRRWARLGVRVASAEPLCHAASHGYVDVIRCLVQDLGADVNEEQPNGMLPLLAAAKREELDVMRCLKELGADVNQMGEGEFAFTPLYAAAYIGSLPGVQCLVDELGADLNRGRHNGSTPLHVAARHGHVSVVRFLGRLGADANQANDEDSVPLSVAAEGGHLSVVKCLHEEFDVGVDQARRGGFTPLMDAAYGSKAEVIKYLAKRADTQSSHQQWGTAADISRSSGGPDEQTKYLMAKAHCSNPACSGAGITKCTGCKKARYCGQPCQLAHWKVHKVACKEASKMRATEGNRRATGGK